MMTNSKVRDITDGTYTVFLNYYSFLAVLCCVYIAVVITANYFLLEEHPKGYECMRNIEK